MNQNVLFLLCFLLFLLPLYTTWLAKDGSHLLQNLWTRSINQRDYLFSQNNQTEQHVDADWDLPANFVILNDDMYTFELAENRIPNHKVWKYHSPAGAEINIILFEDAGSGGTDRSHAKIFWKRGSPQDVATAVTASLRRNIISPETKIKFHPNTLIIEVPFATTLDFLNNLVEFSRHGGV